MAKATKNTASMAEAGDVNAEKMKALDAALSQIEKAYGKGSVMRLGDSGTNMNVETVPTGSLSLDIALGLGGVWLGIAPLEDRMTYVEKTVGIPEGQRAFGIFALGYPAQTRTQQDRFDESRIHVVE